MGSIRSIVRSVPSLAFTTLPMSARRWPARPSMGERIEQYSRFSRAPSVAAAAWWTCACVRSTAFLRVSYSSWEMAFVWINVSARDHWLFARFKAALDRARSACAAWSCASYGRGSMVKSRSPFFTSAPSLKWSCVMRPETWGWMETTSRATHLPTSSRYTGTSFATAWATVTGAGGRSNDGGAFFLVPRNPTTSTATTSTAMPPTRKPRLELLDTVKHHLSSLCHPERSEGSALVLPAFPEQIPRRFAPRDDRLGLRHGIIRRPTLHSLALQLRVHRDLRLQESRDRAACFRRFCGLSESLGGGAGDLSDDLQMRLRDGPVRVHAVERDRGRRAQALRHEVHLAELGRERHREAAGVRRGDELLGVGPLAVFEPCRERIGAVLKHATLRRDGAFSGLQVPLPLCRCLTFHLVFPPLATLSHPAKYPLFCPEPDGPDRRDP